MTSAALATSTARARRARTPCPFEHDATQCRSGVNIHQPREMRRSAQHDLRAKAAGVWCWLAAQFGMLYSLL